MKLDESSNRVRAERRNIASWRAEIEKLNDWIQRSESSLPDLEQSEQDAIAFRDEAEWIYEESRKPFLQVEPIPEEATPITVSVEDKLDIRHGKRSSKK